jgi:hypothetical protein
MKDCAGRVPPVKGFRRACALRIGGIAGASSLRSVSGLCPSLYGGAPPGLAETTLVR